MDKSLCLYAVCPHCGKLARVLSHRWDWYWDQDFVTVRCECGIYEVPYADDRVIEVDLDRPPVLRRDRFNLLLPAGMDPQDLWKELGDSILAGWKY